MRGTVLNLRRTSRGILLSGAVGVALALGAGSGGASAQILPTTSSTGTIAPPETTTTTVTTVPETSTTQAETTTTTAPATTTTGTSRPATTESRPTSSTFVPPAGASTTVTTSPEAGNLDAKTGRLPLFVSLSLGGFVVAIAILTVQWVRSRPRKASAT